MAILFCLAVSVFLGIVFNIKLNSNRDYLKSLGRYDSVDFSTVYTDANSQIKILKKIFSPEVEIEKNLRVLIILTLIFFMLAFLQLLLLFVNK